MAVSDRMTGPNLYVEYVHSGGTVNLTGDQRTLSVAREQELVDATAGADGARVNKATLKNFSATLECLYIGTAGSATHGALALGLEGTLRYYPKGTASGNPKGAFPAIVQSSSLEIPFDDMVTFTFEFAGQGAEIWDPFTSVV